MTNIKIQKSAALHVNIQCFYGSTAKEIKQKIGFLSAVEFF